MYILVDDFVEGVQPDSDVAIYLHCLGTNPQEFELEKLESFIPASWISLLHAVVFNEYDRKMEWEDKHIRRKRFGICTAFFTLVNLRNRNFNGFQAHIDRLLEGTGAPPIAKTVLYTLGISLHHETSRVRQQNMLVDTQASNLALLSQAPALGFSLDNKLYIPRPSDHSLPKNISTVTRIAHILALPPGLKSDGWKEPEVNPFTTIFSRVVDDIFDLSEVEGRQVYQFHHTFLQEQFTCYLQDPIKVSSLANTYSNNHSRLRKIVSHLRVKMMETPLIRGRGMKVWFVSW